MFAREWWNVSARVSSELPRTTNSLEAWHSALGKSIIINHPDVWTLMRQLKSETVSVLAAIANTQVSTATQLAIHETRRKHYADMNKIIQKVLQELEDEELAVMPFLRTIAQRIELAV